MEQVPSVSHDFRTSLSPELLFLENMGLLGGGGGENGPVKISLLLSAEIINRIQPCCNIKPDTGLGNCFACYKGVGWV